MEPLSKKFWRKICICALSLATVALAQSPPGYAKPGDCTPCHQTISETYARTAMGRSWRSWADAPRVEDLSRNNKVLHKPSARHYDIREQGGRAFLRRQQLDAAGNPENLYEKELHFVLGSGNHARSYVHRTPLGKMLAMPVSWYAERGGFWEMAPGYERADQIDFRREITPECLFCHAAYPDATGDIAAIDCQRCHGPGIEHVSAAKAGKPAVHVRAMILNPARLSRERQLEVCYQCHLLTTSGNLPGTIRREDRNVFSYRPGEPLGDYIVHFDHAAGSGREDKFEVVSAAYRLRQSACFQKSELTCTTCHNPHSTPSVENTKAHYSSVCVTCHRTENGNLKGRPGHEVNADCVSCHMARRRPEDATHTTLTDHKIERRPTVVKSVAARSPYSGEVVLYYPTQLPDGIDRDLLLGLAQVREAVNDHGGIKRLAGKNAPRSTVGRQALAGLAAAYGRAGEWRRAMALYEELAVKYPNDPPVLQKWGGALLDLNQPANAIRPLEKARAAAPADTATMHLLGEAYRRARRLPEAIDVLQQCTRADPEQPACFVSLGVAEYHNGNRSGARKALEHAVLVAPELAEAHNSLAGVLVTENTSEAIKHYRRAIELNKNLVEAYVGFGSALLRTGDSQGARSAWEQALKLNPSDALLHVNLGTLLARSGDAEGAAQRYRHALELNPRLGQAHLNLGITLLKVGRRSDAVAHLRKAAESDDPATRKAALAALDNAGTK